MIAGIILGVSLAINFTSFLFIIGATTGIMKENLATGAVIGVSQVPSYALITLILSLVSTFFLIAYIKNKH